MSYDIGDRFQIVIGHKYYEKHAITWDNVKKPFVQTPFLKSHSSRTFIYRASFMKNIVKMNSHLSPLTKRSAIDFSPIV